MKTVDEILEDIQKAQVDAGGRFMKRSELRNMTVGQLLELLVPNNVEFNIKHKRDCEDI